MAAERFRGLRLEIATVLVGRWLTLYETARALGKRSGDIQKTLRAMHAEEILVCEDEEPEQGSRFSLAERLEEELSAALRADQIPGLIGAGQDLLLLTAPARRILDEAFSRGDVAGVVSWAARLGSATSVLVAVAPKASETDYLRLLATLEAAGVEVGSHRTSVVDDGRTVRARALAAVDAATVAAGRRAYRPNSTQRG